MKRDIEALLSLGQSRTTQTSSLVGRAQNVATVISVVVIGIVALVGILIFGEVYDAMPTDGPLDDEASDIVAGFGDAIGLVPIILIVLLASVVIGVVQRMRGR